MPDKALCAFYSLYEVILDFYECERQNGENYEDDIYVKSTEYGQIHRLVELWHCFVNVGNGRDRMSAMVVLSGVYNGLW